VTASLQTDVPLSALTTLGVGGPARGLGFASDHPALLDCLERADADDAPLLVLGGGSNLLVADGGFDGHVLRLTDTAITVVASEPARVRVRVGAGRDWDDFVAWAVERELGGIECLSGIPGRVGAAPMQNIGAYGQEVAEVIAAVYAVDRRDGSVRRFTPADCGFGYRTSHFKHVEPDRWIVTNVEFDLTRDAAPTLRYGDLRRRAEALDGAPTLGAVRDLVLAVRREKAMVLDPLDANARSAGSFFTNPILSEDEAETVAARAGADAMPRWQTASGVKLAAAWLIEQAGFPRGYGDGPAGLSERHTLAIVNRGGARARDIADLAATIRRGVRDAFGVTLVPEPVFVGWLGASTDDSTAVLDAIDAGDL